MTRYTVHTESGDLMHIARTRESAIKDCDSREYKCKVCIEIQAPSPWFPHHMTKHATEIYRNFK